jgi:hypothetical protein
MIELPTTKEDNMKKTMAKLFALGLGAACGVGALVAFAPSDVEVVAPTSVEPQPTSVVVEGTNPTPTTLPSVTPAPTPTTLPELDTACHEEDPCWDPQTMGNGQGSLPTPPEPTAPQPAPAPAPTEATASTAPAPGTTWNGFLVGEVIVCPAGLEVAIDRYPDGTTWAACM